MVIFYNWLKEVGSIKVILLTKNKMTMNIHLRWVKPLLEFLQLANWKILMLQKQTRGDLLRSLPCAMVWNWKMTFFHGLQNQIKVLPPFTMYQIIDKKCMGQPPRVFIGRWDYFSIFRWVTPWRDLFLFWSTMYPALWNNH